MEMPEYKEVPAYVCKGDNKKQKRYNLFCYVRKANIMFPCKANILCSYLTRGLLTSVHSAALVGLRCSHLFAK